MVIFFLFLCKEVVCFFGFFWIYFLFMWIFWIFFTLSPQKNQCAKNVKKSCCIRHNIIHVIIYSIKHSQTQWVYDILCGACLLNIIRIPILNTLHADMFHPALATNDFASRLWDIGSLRMARYDCVTTHILWFRYPITWRPFVYGMK